MQVCALQLATSPSYTNNLKRLLGYIYSLPKKSLIVVPEVYLTGFDYSNLQAACAFSELALQRLLQVVDEQIVVITLIRTIGTEVVNQAVVLHKRTIVHTQLKYRLFHLGNEHKYFSAGSGKDIVKFSIDGVNYGILICFELRFKELWQKLEGADIIIVPAQWGLPRKRHLEVLAQALAVMNQCFVAVANSSNKEMASSSAIYAPMGGVVINDSSKTVCSLIDLGEIELMRRYIDLKQ